MLSKNCKNLRNNRKPPGTQLWPILDTRRQIELAGRTQRRNLEPKISDVMVLHFFLGYYALHTLEAVIVYFQLWFIPSLVSYLGMTKLFEIRYDYSDILRCTVEIMSKPGKQ